MRSIRIHFLLLAILCLVLGGYGERSHVRADDGPASTDGEESVAASDANDDVLAGHSFHGEAFNEGPRQAAYLMEGTGAVSFPVKTSHPEVQRYIDQGVGQLHGFWYFEAERTFRQAAFLDPDCAAAYWGMAMANANNKDRAKKFIGEAVERRENATPRVRRYIDALDKLLTTDDAKEASRDYIKALEKIVYDFPDDIEATAFIALHLWEGRRIGEPIRSHLAVDALIQQVLNVEPMHPVHHYRIHLWDYEKPERALESASLCGQSAPSIAHMWHMPGHIYSRLKRYPDACWQQEASARTDHAQMMRDQLLPDQIHNFAHNNEWLIRNLIFVGRMHEALDLAMNMLELPRHPKYNTLDKGGCSASYGRMRLIQTLSDGEMWQQAIELSQTPYLERTEDFGRQVEWLRLVARAHYRLGQNDRGAELREELEQLLKDKELEQEKAAREAADKVRNEPLTGSTDNANETESSDDDADKDDDADDAAEAAKADDKPAEGATEAESGQADSDDGAAAKDADEASAEKALKKKIDDAQKKARRRFSGDVRRVKRAINEMDGHEAVMREDWETALKKFNEASDMSKGYLAWLTLKKGDAEAAIEMAQRDVDSSENETLPLAHLAFVQWEAGKTDDAVKTLERLARIAEHLDLSVTPFSRLAPLAAQAGLPRDWRQPLPTRDDVGIRPDLDQLGPFRWQPSEASDWTLASARQGDVTLSDYRGKPVIVIFYLGWGCLHCAEQLQAFGPRTADFQAAGIDLLAVSSDDQEGLQKSFENYTGGEIPFPLVADSKLDVFRRYRVFDDFEDQPLHGTFLIDGAGRIRWHDISYEPFMDHEFLLREAKRLLSQ